MINNFRSGTANKLLVALLVWLAGIPYGNAEDPALVARFLNEAPRNTALLDKLMFRAKCTSERFYVTTSDSFREVLKQRYAASGQPRAEIFEVVNYKHFVKATGNTGSTEYIMAKNSGYAFRITSKPGMKKYAITWLEQCGVDPVTDERVANESVQVRVLPLAAGLPFGMTLAELIESPNFKLKEVSAGLGRDELVRVTFEYLPENERKRLTDAVLICDPTRNWAVKEYQATIRGKSTLRSVIEFGETIGGFPIAKTVTSVSTSASKDVEAHTTTEVEVSTSRDVSEEEFYLSYYGLPEPNFGGGWFGNWVWYLVAGIACLYVSQRIVKRRHSVV